MQPAWPSGGSKKVGRQVVASPEDGRQQWRYPGPCNLLDPPVDLPLQGRRNNGGEPGAMLGEGRVESSDSCVCHVSFKNLSVPLFKIFLEASTGGSSLKGSAPFWDREGERRQEGGKTGQGWGLGKLGRVARAAAKAATGLYPFSWA